MDELCYSTYITQLIDLLKAGLQEGLEGGTEGVKRIRRHQGQHISLCILEDSGSLMRKSCCEVR